MAVIVDGEKTTDMPANPLGQDGKYYKVEVNCGSSKTEGLWDYNAWRLNLDYIESNSKCNLTFTSSMTKDQYNEYIKSGVVLRRNTYRGKNITEYKDLDKDNPMNLYKQISSGTFADIYVGDYIVSEQTDSDGKNIIWLIADLDNYYTTGTPLALYSHHATIIPANILEQASMNSEATTKDGYAGSEMVKTTLGEIKETGEVTGILGKYIYPDFKDHIIKYSNVLTTAVTETNSNMYGQTTGASSSWDWKERYLDLMSEVNVFGTLISSSSAYDVGIDNQQYSIFKLKPELKAARLDGVRFSYWLKGVSGGESFNMIDATGYSANASANNLLGVRPRFLID